MPGTLPATICSSAAARSTGCSEDARAGIAAGPAPHFPAPTDYLVTFGAGSGAPQRYTSASDNMSTCALLSPIYVTPVNCGLPDANETLIEGSFTQICE